jgi:hypothetical protein
MTALDLDRAPTVATAGVPLFADELAAQAVSAVRVDWAPPTAGAEAALKQVVLAPGTAAATAESARRLTTARALWVDVRPAAEVLGLDRGEFLHAGPPVDWAHACGPLRGALLGAMVYEGLADTVEEAETLAAQGAVRLAPCHSRGAVGPMAGVVSASMPMSVFEETEYGGRSYCSLNEGLGKVLRFGAYAPEVIDRLRWMQSVLGPALAAVLRVTGPVDVPMLIAQALQMGDECHNRNRAATSLLVRELAPALLDSGLPSSDAAAVLRFIVGNDHFFLNLSMPASKAAADAARNIPGSALVVAMARNGTELGIQVSGTGDEWFTAPAPMVEGLFLPGFGPEDANPDLGDSTITETAGIGGFAMAAAPAIVRFVGGDVASALANSRRMYEITATEHPLYQIPALGFRGTPAGIDVTKVVRTGVLPIINTGIAGAQPGVGQVGAGLVSPPMSVFVDAVRSLARQTDSVHTTKEE